MIFSELSAKIPMNMSNPLPPSVIRLLAGAPAVCVDIENPR